MKKIFSFLIAALFSASMWAATETTVYYAIPDAAKGSYTLKMNTLQQTGENNEVWRQYAMEPTAYTYEDVPVYSCTYTDLWDGVQVIQFQLYDGDNFVSQQTGVNDWKAATKYNGKLFLYTKKMWVNLSESADNTFYLKNGWGGSSDWTWSGAMTAQGAGVYTLSKVLLGSKSANVNTFAEENIGGVYIETISGDFDLSDTVDVSLDFSTMTLSATLAGKPRPVIKMHGTFTGDWANTNAFIVDTDPEHPTASLKLTLAASRDYYFGMRIGSDEDWTSNGKTFTTDNPSWEVIKGEGQLKLVTDKEGEYTFTWAFDTNTLTVIYPSGGGGTALDNTEAGAKAVKRLVNGQLVIVKGDKTFNALGAEVK